MVAEIKFCGMTRAEDARLAGELGASYVGVIFAPSPRRRTLEQAREILAAAAPPVRAVGVFGEATADEVASAADALGLDCVQLHADPDERAVRAVRRVYGGEVWAALRCAGRTLPESAEALLGEADAVVLDARAPGQLGGTGVRLEWAAIAEELSRFPRRAKLVLAGGLTPDNVAAAAAAMSPDVVDVSSGVESSPGIKDHARMRAFADAVRSASLARGVKS
ncbi:MAG TPA: phosphoribosylanthranilate isomerase [Gemmatimonadaceae bacterium]|nr:phosphoribosylanthranilate isomerase [Gemmatimonadaceae bacterium]